jgi:hypothetical protein
MTTLALYEIAADYRAAVEKLADLDLPPEVIEDTLASLSGDLEAKAVSVACFVRNLEATAEQIKQAEAQMAARRKALENRAARVKDYLLANMMVTGVQKIECPLFRIGLRENPPAVEVYEPGLIPAEFMTQPVAPPPSPNKTAIAGALKAGIEVPGAKLTRGTRLEIK